MAEKLIESGQQNLRGLNGLFQELSGESREAYQKEMTEAVQAGDFEKVEVMLASLKSNTGKAEVVSQKSGGQDEKELLQSEVLSEEEEEVIAMVKVFYRITRDYVDEVGRNMPFDTRAVETYKKWIKNVLQNVLERIAKKKGQSEILVFVSESIPIEFGGRNNKAEIIRKVFGPFILKQQGWAKLPK